jgi:hypothetical protein
VNAEFDFLNFVFWSFVLKLPYLSTVHLADGDLKAEVSFPVLGAAIFPGNIHSSETISGIRRREGSKRKLAFPFSTRLISPRRGTYIF